MIMITDSMVIFFYGFPKCLVHFLHFCYVIGLPSLKEYTTQVIPGDQPTQAKAAGTASTEGPGEHWNDLTDLTAKK